MALPNGGEPFPPETQKLAGKQRRNLRLSFQAKAVLMATPGRDSLSLLKGQGRVVAGHVDSGANAWVPHLLLSC